MKKYLTETPEDIERRGFAYSPAQKAMAALEAKVLELLDSRELPSGIKYAPYDCYHHMRFFINSPFNPGKRLIFRIDFVEEA